MSSERRDEFCVVGEQSFEALAFAHQRLRARGSAQMVGSAVFSSMAASSRRRRAESKILPQIAHFVADRGVGVFEIAKHMDLVYGNLRAQAEGKGECCDQSAQVGEEIAVAV